MQQIKKYQSPGERTETLQGKEWDDWNC